MAFANGGSIVTNGLVLSLDAADRNSYVSGSTTWSDLTGNGNNGTLTNGPTFNTGSGGAIVFDGSNDYCITNYTNNPTYFTFECTLKVNDPSSTKVFVGKYNGAGDAYWMGVYTGGQQFIFSVNSGVLNSGVTVSTSQIYTVSCIVGSVNQEIYVNGAIKNSTGTTTTSPGGGLVLAAFGSNLGFYSNINIYNFRFYNRALSATEIAQNYNATKTRFGL